MKEVKQPLLELLIEVKKVGKYWAKIYFKLLGLLKHAAGADWKSIGSTIIRPTTTVAISGNASPAL